MRWPAGLLFPTDDPPGAVLFDMSPLDVDGVIVAADRLPDLSERVGRIAKSFAAPPPTRIIVGLSPLAFVLRGSGLLPLQETLYLPLLAFRVLDAAELGRSFPPRRPDRSSGSGNSRPIGLLPRSPAASHSVRR